MTVTSGLQKDARVLSDQSVEDQWSVIRDSLCAAGRQHLGFARRNQPDWFTENQAIIKPLLEETTVLESLGGLEI